MTAVIVALAMVFVANVVLILQLRRNQRATERARLQLAAVSKQFTGKEIERALRQYRREQGLIVKITSDDNASLELQQIGRDARRRGQS